jgi:hypothetical protein
VASAELYVVVDVPKRSTGTDANVPLRGVEPAAFEVRPKVRIVEGAAFRPGRNEVIVGRAAAREFAGLDVGNRLSWGENEWQVVGVFAAEDSVYESEIWTDVRVLQPAYRRGSGFQSVYARLESPDSFQRFKDALTADPRLDVDVMREDDYYAEHSRVLRSLVNTLGNLIALLMAVGATFGALNTMYSAVAARSREIATLRALGFQGGTGRGVGHGRVAPPGARRRARGRGARLARRGRLSDRHDELAVVQPGRVQPERDAPAPRRRHRVRARDGLPRRHLPGDRGRAHADHRRPPAGVAWTPACPSSSTGSSGSASTGSTAGCIASPAGSSAARRRWARCSS